MNNKILRQLIFFIVVMVVIFNVSYRLGYDRALAESVGKNFTKEDFKMFLSVWNIIRENFVDVSKIDSQKAMFEATRGLLRSLDDPYSDIYSEKQAKIFEEDLKGSFGGVGFEIGIRNGVLTVIAPLEGTPAERAGFKPGDRILKIDGESTENMPIDEAVSKIRGKPGTKVTLTIFREGWADAKDFEITREIITIQVIKSKFIPPNIGYIKINSFNQNTYSDFKSEFNALKDKGADRFIIDLRNNPGGYLKVAVMLSELFLERGKVILREKKRSVNEIPILSKGPGTLKREKVIILINRGSASASEIFASALRDNLGVKLVGEKSFGKGSVQQIFYLPPLKIIPSHRSTGSESSATERKMIKLTVDYWLTPKGMKLEGNGLVPDVEVKDEITTTTDAILDKAVELIKFY
ncbi:MAG: S41 family peptidase [Patescibacteria group bacterium]|nr:S41 family peptidase [Patescibacteria group bacterium]